MRNFGKQVPCHIIPILPTALAPHQFASRANRWKLLQQLSGLFGGTFSSMRAVQEFLPESESSPPKPPQPLADIQQEDFCTLEEPCNRGNTHTAATAPFRGRYEAPVGDTALGGVTDSLLFLRARSVRRLQGSSDTSNRVAVNQRGTAPREMTHTVFLKGHEQGTGKTRERTGRRRLRTGRRKRREDERTRGEKRREDSTERIGDREDKREDRKEKIENREEEKEERRGEMMRGEKRREDSTERIGDRKTRERTGRRGEERRGEERRGEERRGEEDVSPPRLQPFSRFSPIASSSTTLKLGVDGRTGAGNPIFAN
ncbi:hypothetical protein D4764_14G0011460 [Takifugu flavidus]|uniref:Uncharacterized protein n=1 Tax=Takifugu flavidus TaxID=433684 RepID=A0A5C6P6M5_9TELE|nr:hypothetical protein D4764_14G0011460 [Takifugu flavidus]